MKLSASLRAAYFFAVGLGALAGCGPGGSDQVAKPIDSVRIRVVVENLGAARSRGGTLFTLKSPDGRIIAAAGIPSTWSTYCASDLGEVHFFVRSPNSTEVVSSIPKPDPRIHSGFGFVRGQSLFAVDLANDRNYRFPLDGQGTPGTPHELESPWRDDCPSAFQVGEISYESFDGFVSACRNDDEFDCDTIEIARGTWVYSYAEAAGSVLAATNYGDILIHRSSGWCRAVLVAEIYRCPDAADSARPIFEPTGVQFYSAINYYGQELMGQFPDGKLYQFDGAELRPWEQDRPLDMNQPGREAQSLASYCGDLYVGYWPRGEIWRFDGANWTRVIRLFTHPAEESPFVPYSNRSIDDLPGSFFGQRVTALSLGDDSLYAFTSNLGGWTEQIQTTAMSSAQADEYGATYRLRRPSCLTFRLPPNEETYDLLFEIGPTSITVSRAGVIVAKTAIGETLLQEEDVLEVGDGVFGTMDGPSVHASRAE